MIHTLGITIYKTLASLSAWSKIFWTKPGSGAYPRVVLWGKISMSVCPSHVFQSGLMFANNPGIFSILNGTVHFKKYKQLFEYQLLL
jgi:hypothetical protein